MAKKSFMPKGDLEKQQWLQNFAGKLSTYATKYAIDADDVNDMVASSESFSYWLDYQKQYADYSHKLTDFKNELRDGVPSGSSVQPTPPTVAGSPGVVGSGIFARAASLAANIKNKMNYTEADGKDLGIEGAEESSNPQSMKPALKIRLVSGGHPEIVWTKHGMDSIEIYADHGTGSFAFLAIDTMPNYTDMNALPPGTGQLWKYKAIYRLRDEQVGEWSDVVSVSVMG